MSQLDLTGCKKRRRGDRVFRFKSFGEHGYPTEFSGPFRENVKALLEFGHLETNLCGAGMHCWSFQLEVNRHPPVHILLFVIEELIGMSTNRHCKQCQFIGWGHHMICNKKYHFLMPSKDTMVAACFSGKEVNDPVAAGPGSYCMSNFLVQSQGHVMHGVFHSNGFGHLLCINGLEGGSDLTGHSIVEFWDRLCTRLRVRRVSLNDTSQKRGMELRLIHGVAYGQPWFGRWGYTFGRGTYCVTQQMYQKALEALRGMPLTFLNNNHNYNLCHIQNYNNYHINCQGAQDIPLLFSKYQTLADHSLATLGDLFNFMLELKSRLPKDTSNMESYNPGILVETTCRWSPKRIEMATRVIVEALKRARFRWVSRQEVRDAARNYIGDTGLLDFVLKSLGNQIVGNYLVRRSLNPVTKVLEYCLEDVSNHVFATTSNNNNKSNSNNNQEGNNNLVLNGSRIRARYKITRLQLMKDMFYLYKYVLKENKVMSSSGVVSAIPVAVRMVLDSKYLVKEYFAEIPLKSEVGNNNLEGKFNLYCTVLLKNNMIGDQTNSNKPMILPPYECVTMRNNATIDELKHEVEMSFREIYWSLRGLVVESIHNVMSSNIINGKDLVLGNYNLVEVGQRLVFEGSIKRKENRNDHDHDHHEIHVGESCDDDFQLYECGSSDNVVCVMECPCGAKEDDGERRVCCDICETWQHTRCVGIPNSEQVPHIFLCARCEQEIVLLPDSLP